MPIHCEHWESCPHLCQPVKVASLNFSGRWLSWSVERRHWHTIFAQHNASKIFFFPPTAAWEAYWAVEKLRAEIKEQMLDSILHDLYWQGFSRRLLQSSTRRCVQRDAELALGVFSLESRKGYRQNDNSAAPSEPLGFVLGRGNWRLKLPVHIVAAHLPFEDDYRISYTAVCKLFALMNWL